MRKRLSHAKALQRLLARLKLQTLPSIRASSRIYAEGEGAKITPFDTAELEWKQTELFTLGLPVVKAISEASIASLFQRLVIPAQITKDDDSSFTVLFEYQQQRIALGLLQGSNFVSLTSHWHFGNEMSAPEALARCNRLNRKLRYVKLQYLPQDQSVLISIEYIARTIDDIGTSLRSYLDALDTAARAITA